MLARCRQHHHRSAASKRAAADLLADLDEASRFRRRCGFYVTWRCATATKRARAKWSIATAPGPRPRWMSQRQESQIGQPKRGPLVKDPTQGMAIAYPRSPWTLMADDYNGDAMWRDSRSTSIPRSISRRWALGDLHRQAITWIRDRRLHQVPEDSIFRRPSQLSIAESYRRQEKFAEAEGLLRKLMDGDKSDISAAQQLGQLLRSNKKFEDAAKVYGVAIDRLGTLEPEDWQRLLPRHLYGRANMATRRRITKGAGSRRTSRTCSTISPTPGSTGARIWTRL